VRCGDGPPLIIVPAMVSLIRQWLPLAQFMGQRFRAHFFELPGHGGSTPYPTRFRSELVPPTVEALADRLGYERFSLMGFSFGGLLALRTLEYLQQRIDKFILLSPSVSQRALRFSAPHKAAFRLAARTLQIRAVQNGAHRLMTTPALENVLIGSLSRATNIQASILRSKNALHIPVTTLDVLACTLEEIVTMEYRPARGPFEIPCFFGMSIHDDLLQYDLTEHLVREMFPNLTIQKFTHPYHQPPQPPTFEWLTQDFGHLLDMLDA
jgi:pimeloyl-ACP methyl ester carboxylesterase